MRGSRCGHSLGHCYPPETSIAASQFVISSTSARDGVLPVSRCVRRAMICRDRFDILNLFVFIVNYPFGKERVKAISKPLQELGDIILFQFAGYGLQRLRLYRRRSGDLNRGCPGARGSTPVLTQDPVGPVHTLRYAGEHRSAEYPFKPACMG